MKNKRPDTILTLKSNSITQTGLLINTNQQVNQKGCKGLHTDRQYFTVYKNIGHGERSIKKVFTVLKQSQLHRLLILNSTL